MYEKSNQKKMGWKMVLFLLSEAIKRGRAEEKL
jgi:hypothetical protein